MALTLVNAILEFFFDQFGHQKTLKIGSKLMAWSTSSYMVLLMNFDQQVIEHPASDITKIIKIINEK